ncbi:MAG TPA: SDR family NAD(P)-dependent oxidoreductase [Steroidobacteraceae bacterium]|nr:SDR family NAD(P)-dependent oxidoreductase [Steroidobacteraceae bacterium]
MIRATRVAIVTGASGGIGGKVIRRLAADGFATVLGYAGNKEVADQTVADIQAVGTPVRAVRANVTVNSEVARLFDQALDAFGRIDAVVHCAGITPLSLPPLNHRAWTKADGAPSGIRNIAQSADGTLWLASSHGLFRFDGLRFIRYDGPANQRFASNNVAALTALPSRT